MLRNYYAILIFEGSGGIQVHEFANKNFCQLELSLGLSRSAAAKKHQQIHNQPIPFSNFIACATAPKQ